MPISLWDEVQGVDFGDKRLDRRFGQIVQRLGTQPNLSIPAATKSRAEMEAAYRFFDNKKVSPERILEPHFAATRERISECDLVLLVQDTTEVDVTRPNQQVDGAGPMDCDSRRGGFLHPLIAFTPEGLPLGTVWQKTWTRDRVERDLTPQEKNQKRKHTPIEEKESMRWIEGLRVARDVAQECSETACVCVCDSEGDIYEMLSEPRKIEGSHGEVHLLIRAAQPRATQDHGNWLDKVRNTDCLYEGTVDVSARTAKIAPKKQSKRNQARGARIANVEVRATSITLRPPWRHDRKHAPVRINVVLVEEANAPEDCVPVQWLLVTTLPIETPEQVRQIVCAYCVRWQIEIFFRTIKSGCRIQKRLFEAFSRLHNCISVYMIIAWRIMYLCRLGRQLRWSGFHGHANTYLGELQWRRSNSMGDR